MTPAAWQLRGPPTLPSSSPPLRNSRREAIDRRRPPMFPATLIVQLTASGNLEEALALCKLLPLEDSSLRAAKEQSIHISRKLLRRLQRRKASENVKNTTIDAPEIVNKVSGQVVELGYDVQSSLQSRGKIAKGAKNAFNLEKKRIKD
nr:Vam6/Vps39-like protein [Ipomoea batatas]